MLSKILDNIVSATRGRPQKVFQFVITDQVGSRWDLNKLSACKVQSSYYYKMPEMSPEIKLGFKVIIDKYDTKQSKKTLENLIPKVTSIATQQK